MNERHKGQLKIAHQLYDKRDLKQELLWQREFLDTGYLSYQQVCYNKWIFDECLKRLEERKAGKILVSDKYRVPMYECLGCKNPVMEFWKYCPSCGNNIEVQKNE